MGHGRRSVGAAAAVLALLAAACGGDDGDGEGSSVIDEGARSALGEREIGGAGSAEEVVEHPTTMQDWERLWEQQRADVVAEIRQNAWGLQADGRTVLGPDGFTIDLSRCTNGFSDTEGLTDSEIRFGATGPASGVAADAVNINRGEEAVLAHYGDAGAFTDSTGKTRKVNYLLRDDGYDPARTIPLVDELIDSQKVFIVQNQGSANALRVYDKLNSRCIPHLFNITGHPAWGDPVNHPWTTGHQIAYNVEALLWAAFIEQRAAEFDDGPIVVAALAMNNDFGKVYDAAFREAVATSSLRDRVEYHVEWFEPTAATVTNEMTTLASKSPDVYISMMTGSVCAQAIVESAQNGMDDTAKFRFVPSVCKTNNYVGRPVVGDNADGWWTFGGGYRDITSGAEDGNAFVKWGRELLTAKGYDYRASGYFSWGLVKGWGLAQILQIAGELDGGLTKANVITAARAVDMTNPGLPEGMRWNMRGNSDAYYVEGSEVATWDAASQSWTQEGDVIDLSGRTEPCPWDQARSSCG